MKSNYSKANNQRANELKRSISGTIIAWQTLALLLFPALPAFSAKAIETPTTPPVLSSVASRVGTYVWPAPSPKGIVIAVHGMTQDGNCFASLAQSLNARGFTTIAMDLRGHGKCFLSTGTPGGKNKLSYPKSAQDLLELATSVRCAYPKTPIFCIGESVGSGVATLAASQNPNLFDGIILASPGTRPHIFNPLMVTRDFIVGITDLQRQLDVRPYITRYSSEDPRITNEMITDKLSRTTLSGEEILRTAAFLRHTPKNASKLSPNVPVLILQGDNDRIVELSTVKTIMRHITSPDKKMVVFPHCGHILLGTAFLKPPVVKQLTDWLVAETDSNRAKVATLHSEHDIH